MERKNEGDSRSAIPFRKQRSKQGDLGIQFHDFMFEAFPFLDQPGEFLFQCVSGLCFLRSSWAQVCGWQFAIH